MKTLLRLIGTLAVIGIISASCTELGESYEGSSWYGETGPQSSLTITFTEGTHKCTVLEVSGCCGLGFEYDVEWSARDSFKLLLPDGETSIICYTGVISGDWMSLDMVRDNRIERTYELKRKTP